MSIFRVALAILFIGFLIYLYINFLPHAVEKFQQWILNEPVKKEEVEKQSTSEIKKEDKKIKNEPDKSEDIYEKKAEEEVNKILGLKKEEKPKEESIVDKFLNYIKMLKDKILNRG
ncbi:MAG: hypothetical protein N2Z81_05890 [Hydrogenothermaceae bacterium]|nr:hypothetical protein [Hydrogenothermaceae bacterium]